MFEWSEFRPGADGLKKVFGPLEADIMDIMWEKKKGTAREVYDDLLKKEKEVRRSTISIMMNRLCDRGLLDKNIDKGRGGLRYIYTIKIGKQKFESRIVEEVISGLFDTFGSATSAYIYSYINKTKK
ncbi:MAG: BlaI/MecI/CopY family transcriptional regulator [Candidatus Methanofastidiosia archaeon]